MQLLLVGDKMIHDNWNDINGDDIKNVSDYMRNESLACIDGGVLKKFEDDFACYIGTKYAVAYSSGTAAIYAAVYACDCGRGTNTILSEYSYFGAVYAVLENQGIARLCPFDSETLNIDVAAIHKFIDSNTKAVLITHTWGNPCDMDKLNQIKQQYDIKIISDASHAHGAEWRGKKIGNIDCEDIACFSLGKGKLISGGELGIAVTNNKILYDKLLMLGHPNRIPNALIGNEFINYSNGFGIKLRPHTLSMVIARNQLKKYNRKARLNRETNMFLENEIDKIDGFKTIKKYEKASRVYWKLLIRIKKEYWKDWSVEEIVKRLKINGVDTEQFHNYDFKYENDISYNVRYLGQLDNCSNMMPPNDLIFLPTYIDVNKKEMEKIINAFKNVSYERKFSI